MMKFEGIDGIDPPKYPIVEEVKSFINGDYMYDQYGNKKKDSTIKKLENKIVSGLLDDLMNGEGTEEIIAIDNGVILITALYDFVSSKHALDHLYRRYQTDHAEYLERTASAMVHGIELIEDLTINGGLRSARRKMTIITLRALLGTLEAYATLLFQIDTTQMTVSDKVLCSCAVGSLSGGIRTLLGFTYVVSERIGT